MLTVKFRFACSSIVMRAFTSGVISDEQKDDILTKAYEYATAHPAPYVPAIIAIERSYKLDSSHILLTAKIMDVENFESQNTDNRPTYGECQEDYKKFLSFFVKSPF